MSLSALAKKVSIASGLYRPARWLTRQIRPAQHKPYYDDIEMFRSLLPPNALCFDVGANIGEKSEALVAVGARVIAFEPNPMVLPELQARCGRLPHWTLVPAAVGKESAIATLHAREAHANSGLLSGGDGILAKYEVPVVTLDAAIQRFGVPDFCKIDVEGWELEVLMGLSQPIPLISFEFTLSERGIKKSLGCLKNLAEFGSGYTNLTPAETSAFHFGAWKPLAELLAWFPGDLKTSLPGDGYGDIYIKRDRPPTGG